MKNFKKVIATFLSALMVTGSMACGASAVSTNQESNVKNKTKQTLIYPNKNDKKKKTYVEGEAVVMMKGSNLISSGASLNKIMDVSSSIKVEKVSDFKEKKNSKSVVTVSSKKLSTEKIIEQLKGEDDVLIAEPNYICKASAITDDKYSEYQWALENKGINNGKVGEDIKPSSMWNKKSTGDSTPVVAIIDSGVNYNHEDLKGKMWVNPYQNKLRGVHGFDFTGTVKNSEPMDSDGHGTHCAGIIGATRDNKVGIAGVADNVKIMALKFLDDSGQGTTDDAIAAYNYIYNAQKLGVNVVAVNASWGSYDYSKILLDVINQVGKEGAITVAASGNESTNLDNAYDFNTINDYDDDYDEEFSNKKYSELDGDPFSYYSYPACYDSNYIVSVGASGEDGKLANYSNYGIEKVDTIAPGTDILSTVSNDCFLPTIYNQEELNERCQQYITKDFNANTSDLSDNKDGIKITETNTGYDDGLGDKTCLKVDFSTTDNNNLYAIEIPYTVTSNGDKGTYGSFMYSFEKAPNGDDSDYFTENGIYFAEFAKDEEYTFKDVMNQEIGYYLNGTGSWSHVEIPKLTPAKVTGERKLVIVVSYEDNYDFSLKLDNFGVSKGTVNESENFGQYDIYSGTSMATPYVAGSIALMKDKDSSLTTEQLIEKVKNSVHQTTLVDGKAKSSGVLSLDKTNSVIPRINSWENKNGKSVVKGVNFDNIQKVTVNDKNVKYTVKNSTEITIEDNNYYGGICTLKVYSKDGYGYYSAVSLKGTRYKNNGIISLEESIFNYDIVSDGKYFYCVDDRNALVRYSIDKDGIIRFSRDGSFQGAMKVNFADITNGSKTKIKTTSPVYYNGNIYIYADYYLNSESNEDDFYVKKSAIITYNVSTCKNTIQTVEGIDLAEQAIAVYNKSLYLIGGYDYSTGEFSDAVYKKVGSSWQKVTSLPEKRARGKALQYGNKLIYSLGINESGTCPKTLIFDGKTWTESKINLGISKFATYYIGNKSYNFYDCGYDLVGNGILLTGRLFENIGDTVVYNPTKDTLTALNYYYQTDSVYGIRGTVVGDKFYGKGYDDTDVCTFSFNVKTGMNKVAVSSNVNGGKVTGGLYYMPNTTAKITVSPNKNFKFNYMLINGKKYTKPTATFTVTKDTSVRVYYISMVTKIKLNRTTLTLKKGKTKQLTATVTPKTATNKSVVWSSNKKSVATVNSKGKVTAKKKGTAIIKATARDGSKVSATCKVTVK